MLYIQPRQLTRRVQRHDSPVIACLRLYISLVILSSRMRPTRRWSIEETRGLPENKSSFRMRCLCNCPIILNRINATSKPRCRINMDTKETRGEETWSLVETARVVEVVHIIQYINIIFWEIKSYWFTAVVDNTKLTKYLSMYDSRSFSNCFARAIYIIYSKHQCSTGGRCFGVRLRLPGLNKFQDGGRPPIDIINLNSFYHHKISIFNIIRRFWIKQFVQAVECDIWIKQNFWRGFHKWRSHTMAFPIHLTFWSI